MRKGLNHIKVFNWLFLLAFLAVACVILIRVAGSPELPGGMRKMLIYSVSLLVLLFVVMFLVRNTTGVQSENNPAEGKDHSEAESAGQKEKPSDAVHPANKKKQGRLVKKCAI